MAWSIGQSGIIRIPVAWSIGQSGTTRIPLAWSCWPIRNNQDSCGLVYWPIRNIQDSCGLVYWPIRNNQDSCCLVLLHLLQSKCDDTERGKSKNTSFFQDMEKAPRATAAGSGLYETNRGNRAFSLDTNRSITRQKFQLCQSRLQSIPVDHPFRIHDDPSKTLGLQLRCLCPVCVLH